MESISKKIIIRVIFILLILPLLSACSTTQPGYAPIVNGMYATTPSGLYKVKRGDTLYSIAWAFGLDYRDLMQRNNLGDSSDIHPGQYLAIYGRHNAGAGKPRVQNNLSPSKPVVSKTYPATWKNPPKKPVTPVTNTTANKVTNNNVTKTSITKSQPITAKPKPVAANPVYLGDVSHWLWPVKGRLLNTFNPSQGSKGIDIAGRIGTPIYATAAGQIVYCGNGLAGYGQLIIIKHNADFLSAYAHNSKVFVKEGQMVKAGQKIALMGNTGSVVVNLHFEIRKAGKPVNPLNYLSK